MTRVSSPSIQCVVTLPNAEVTAWWWLILTANAHVSLGKYTCNRLATVSPYLRPGVASFRQMHQVPLPPCCHFLIYAGEAAKSLLGLIPYCLGRLVSGF